MHGSDTFPGIVEAKIVELVELITAHGGGEFIVYGLIQHNGLSEGVLRCTGTPSGDRVGELFHGEWLKEKRVILAGDGFVRRASAYRYQDGVAATKLTQGSCKVLTADARHMKVGHDDTGERRLRCAQVFERLGSRLGGSDAVSLAPKKQKKKFPAYLVIVYHQNRLGIDAHLGKGYQGLV